MKESEVGSGSNADPFDKLRAGSSTPRLVVRLSRASAQEANFYSISVAISMAIKFPKLKL
jgi:hypothetical protein